MLVSPGNILSHHLFIHEPLLKYIRLGDFKTNIRESYLDILAALGASSLVLNSDTISAAYGAHWKVFN